MKKKLDRIALAARMVAMVLLLAICAPASVKYGRANRLASNSLLECAVFGAAVAEALERELPASGPGPAASAITHTSRTTIRRRASVDNEIELPAVTVGKISPCTGPGVVC